MGSLFWSIFLSRTYNKKYKPARGDHYIQLVAVNATYIAQKSNPSLKIWNLSGGGGGGGSLIGSQ